MNPGVRLETRDLCRVHTLHRRPIRVLDGLSLTIEPGETIAIVGASGSGKSTLMNLLGLLDRPTSGSVLLDGVDVSRMNNSQRAHIRNRRIGFVFQAHHLLPEHTAVANVMMPVRLSGSPTAVARQRAELLLKAVGLDQRMNHRPGELSGGEQQRVALARALVMGPGLLLADEPTGNLDPATASGVFDLMLDLNNALNTTLIVVTHSMSLANRFPRRLHIADGGLTES